MYAGFQANPCPSRMQRLGDLRERVLELEGRSTPRAPDLLQGFPHNRHGSPWSLLRPGAIHEWFGVEDAEEPSSRPGPRAGTRHWTPPLCLLADIARRTMRTAAQASTRDRSTGRTIAWIGRACWPYPRVLLGSSPDQDQARLLLRRSIFIDAADLSTRAWALELALRSASIGVVIADARGLTMAVSRRLQLAARAGGTLGLLARPAHESRALSAATTRWLVHPAAPPDHPRAPGWTPGSAHATDPAHAARWRLRLLRCKGAGPLAPGTDAPRTWTVEWHDATSTVAVSPDVGDGPGAQASSPRSQGLGTRTA